MNKMLKTYNRILCFFTNMHLAWKLTLVYFMIITLPFIITGIYISSTITQSIVHQSGLIAKQSLLQKREIINQKIDSIERTSISITYNTQILKYIEDPFENNLQGYEEYNNTYAPILGSYIIQNKNIYDTMLYIRNNTFPDAWNSIYHIDNIEKDDWYRQFITDNTLIKKWRPLHDSKTKKVTWNIGENRVFSLCRKFISFTDKSCLGLFEVEISEKTLFENLEKNNDILDYTLVVDNQGKIVSDSVYKSLPAGFGSGFFPWVSQSDFNGVIHLNQDKFTVYSIPIDNIGCRLVGITSLKKFNRGYPNYNAIITGVIIIALILFGFIIHFVTKRLTYSLKLLVQGLKSVRDGNINIKLHVKSHDEFGELAESFNHMTDRIHSLIEQVYKAQITEKESELKALEAQINPHFLYNSLSTMSWMARKVKADNIDNLSLQLSQFYRLVLSKGNSIITVEDEINLLKSYVEIEKIRFENMFNVKYDLDETAFSHKMVKIILQPIAENTINHGIAPKDCRGTMILRLRQDSENLLFTIIDDGVGMNRTTLDHINNGLIFKRRESGYAIHNIMERLKSVYGERAQVTIFSRPGIGCTVNVVIPKSPMLHNMYEHL